MLPFWARIETLWLLFVPLVALIFALLQALAPNDLWYHVRAGELAVLAGKLPTTNMMSTGVPLDKPFYYQSWLSEIALYLTVTKFGLSGLQLLRAFVLLAAFVFSISSALRWTKHEDLASSSSARATMLGCLWAFLLLSNNIDLRPQTFSVILCALWVWLLLDFWKNPRIGPGIALCAVSGLWANTHGAFVLAPASIAVLSFAQLFFGRTRAFALGVTAVAASVVTLVNPHGIKLYIYLSSLSNDAISQKYIQEWRSPGFDEWHSILFWVSPLILAVSWRIAKPAKTCFPWLAPIALTWVMGARDQRAMIWFALFTAPLLSLLLAHIIPAPKPAPVPRAAQLINAVLLVFLCVSPLLFLPQVKVDLPWPDSFKSRFARTPQHIFSGDPDLLLERTSATSAVEWWHKNPEQADAKVWTDMVCGSFMTWSTRPQLEGDKAVLPLCDPRIELFPESFWEDYVKLSSGPKGAGAKLLQEGYTQALVDIETQEGLVSELKREKWTNVAHNGSTMLFIAPQPSLR